jgi:peptide/nickel transport system substrate-binding protein
VVADPALLAQWAALRGGTITFEAFCTQFALSPPFLPLAYRQGLAGYSRNFYADLVATVQDIFYNINNW